MKHVKFQQTFICEFYDKQEAVIISRFTSYIGQKKKNQICLDSIGSFHLFNICCSFFVMFKMFLCTEEMLKCGL